MKASEAMSEILKVTRLYLRGAEPYSGDLEDSASKALVDIDAILKEEKGDKRGKGSASLQAF